MRKTILAAVMTLTATFALAPMASAGLSPAPVSGLDGNFVQAQQRGTGVVEGGGNRGGISGRSMGAGPRMYRQRGTMSRGNVFQQRYGQRPSLQQRRYIQRPGVQRRGYYGGYRGYRGYRPGYRSYNGYWFPPAAFGALLGGAIASQAASGNSHVAWCQNRWRSYRVSDNSYQPSRGPRRVCVSPHS